MTSLLAYEDRIAKILTELGIPLSYGQERDMPLYQEAIELVPAGVDVYGREQRLSPHALTCWQGLCQAVTQEGMTLLLVSGFRGVGYQRQILEQKLAKGETLSQILRVNAAPGFSEHHTGRAIDMTVPGLAPVTEEFENCPAFSWLSCHAEEFGFTMTYPRNNTHGIIYEPWHWTVQEALQK
jgi:D-alanyl-D-alanine carboxypeptidase